MVQNVGICWINFHFRINHPFNLYLFWIFYHIPSLLKRGMFSLISHEYPLDMKSTPLWHEAYVLLRPKGDLEMAVFG